MTNLTEVLMAAFDRGMGEFVCVFFCALELLIAVLHSCERRTRGRICTMVQLQQHITAQRTLLVIQGMLLMATILFGLLSIYVVFL